MEIVRAHAEQAAELSRIAIAAKAHWGYPAKWMQLWTPLLSITAEYLRENEVWAILIGQVTGGFYSLAPGPAGTVLLDHMWVLPAYIGKGAGRQLFTHALSRSRELGYRIIQIEADPNAQGFYEHMGAHQTGKHTAMLDGVQRTLPVLEMKLD